MPQPDADNKDKRTDGPAEGTTEGNTRRTFLAKTVRRAAYIAPIIWSISAQQALAGSDDSSIFGTGGGPNTNDNGPPPPE